MAWNPIREKDMTDYKIRQRAGAWDVLVNGVFLGNRHTHLRDALAEVQRYQGRDENDPKYTLVHRQGEWYAFHEKEQRACASGTLKEALEHIEEKETRTPKQGEVWRCNKGLYLVGRIDGGRFVAIGLNSGNRFTSLPVDSMGKVFGTETATYVCEGKDLVECP